MTNCSDSAYVKQLSTVRAMMRGEWRGPWPWPVESLWCDRGARRIPIDGVEPAHPEIGALQ